MPAATDAVTRVSQHLAVWDVRTGTGRITLFAGGDAVPLEVSDLDEFARLVTMLTDPRGAWYDARRQVLSGPRSAGGG